MPQSTIIRPMAAANVPACAAILCSSILGERYGFTVPAIQDRLLSALSAGHDIMIVAEQQAIVAGFAWIDPKGAFSTAPYLRLIAVDSRLGSAGIGSALLREFEARTWPVGRDYCLLVSDFNEKAIRFYAKHGYTKVGVLVDFVRPGINEIIMSKKRTENEAP